MNDCRNSSDIVKDFYGHLYTPLAYKVTLFCLTLFSYSFGLGLNFGIIHYEKFGGDPKKRSATNQLLSASCTIYSILTVVSFTASNWRVVIGPLSIYHARVSLLLRHWLIHACVILSVQILAKKCFDVFNWSFLNRVDDDWLALFLSVVAFVLGALAVTVKVKTGQIIDYDFHLLTGIPFCRGVNEKFGIGVKDSAAG